MSAPDCRYFEECSAPLCPLDEASLSACSWFPNEELCRRRDLFAAWIARARKIARTTGNDPDRGCFTREMLSRNFRATSAIRGLDPTQGPITQDRVRQWLTDHPSIRGLTAQEREKLARRLRKTAPRTGREPSETVLQQGLETGSEAGAVKVVNRGVGG